MNIQKLKRKIFCHSLTREQAALSSKADIIVFITQDIIIERGRLVVYNLTKDIIEKWKCLSSML